MLTFNVTEIMYVWLAIGLFIVLEGWLVSKVFRDLKRFNEEIKPKLIKEGKRIHRFYQEFKAQGARFRSGEHHWKSNRSMMEDEPAWYWGRFFGRTLVHALLSIVWFVSIPCLIIVLLAFGIRTLVGKVDTYLFNEDAKVLRYLKKNPAMMTEIVSSQSHRYYAIAKRLSEAGKIVIERSTQMITVDGKDYVLQVK